ncbi:MAG: hypothetical protein LC733_06215, partial [Actinobacteria bacterium]|nr:hypothetical protein [Actinomycetota bacterium]
ATVMQERFENPREILGDRLREGSLYRLLADTGDRLFGDDYFSTLLTRPASDRREAGRASPVASDFGATLTKPLSAAPLPWVAPTEQNRVPQRVIDPGRGRSRPMLIILPRP